MTKQTLDSTPARDNGGTTGEENGPSSSKELKLEKTAKKVHAEASTEKETAVSVTLDADHGDVAVIMNSRDDIASYLKSDNLETDADADADGSASAGIDVANDLTAQRKGRTSPRKLSDDTARKVPAVAGWVGKNNSLGDEEVPASLVASDDSELLLNHSTESSTYRERRRQQQLLSMDEEEGKIEEETVDTNSNQKNHLSHREFPGAYAVGREGGTHQLTIMEDPIDHQDHMQVEGLVGDTDNNRGRVPQGFAIVSGPAPVVSNNATTTTTTPGIAEYSVAAAAAAGTVGEGEEEHHIVTADLVTDDTNEDAPQVQAEVVRIVPGLLISASVFHGISVVLLLATIGIMISYTMIGEDWYYEISVYGGACGSSGLGSVLFFIFVYRRGTETREKGRGKILNLGIVSCVLGLLKLLFMLYNWGLMYKVGMYVLTVFVMTFDVVALFCDIFLAIGQNDSSKIQQPRFKRKCRFLHIFTAVVLIGLFIPLFILDHPSPYPLPESCNVQFPRWVGDGICDDFPNSEYNTPECDFDGGDCGGSKEGGEPCTSNDECVSLICDGGTNVCAPRPITLFPNCTVDQEWRIGDGDCDVRYDSSYATEECGYDGGDCKISGDFCTNPSQCASGVCDFLSNTCT